MSLKLIGPRFLEDVIGLDVCVDYPAFGVEIVEGQEDLCESAFQKGLGEAMRLIAEH